MLIKIKRVYEQPSNTDGVRILVDRLWPRGISKDKVEIDSWLKDIAPSNQLRKWFNHEPGKWEEFKKKYFHELESNRPGVNQILEHSDKETVTLLYSAKEERFNNAAALREYIENYISPER